MVPSGFMNALEIVGRVHPRDDRAAQRRQQVGGHLDAAAAHAVPLHPRRQRDRPDPDLRRAGAAQPHGASTRPRSRSSRRCCTAASTATGNFNVTAALATISFFADHRRRRARARLRPALEEHGAARAAAAGHDHADPDRDHGHVRAAVRADDATCGQHDRRPHRDPGDPVVRVHLRAAVRAAASAWASASFCRCRSRSASRRSRSSSCSFRPTCSRS